MTALRLVFTDLDGTLLDHHDYGFEAARPALAALATAGVPVIPTTSKTRAEIEPLRAQLDNDHPFIAENGAAVFVPTGYFPDQPADTEAVGGYWVRAFAPPRGRWLALLESLYPDYGDEFEHFARAGATGIAAMTGLSEEGAALANRRDYSEPVQWLGEPPRKAEFVARLRDAGAHPLQGGRFLAVAGDCDKGRALAWLRQVYLEQRGGTCHDLAAGDSGNDVAMLEAAETALLVRSPVHAFPKINRDHGIIRSDACGPAGWAEGITRWLELTRDPRQG